MVKPVTIAVTSNDYTHDPKNYTVKKGEGFTLGTVNRNKKTDPSVLLAGESSVNVSEDDVLYSHNATGTDYSYRTEDYIRQESYTYKRWGIFKSKGEHTVIYDCKQDARLYNDEEALVLDNNGAMLLNKIVNTDTTDGKDVLSELDVRKFAANIKNNVKSFINSLGVNVIGVRVDDNTHRGVYTIEYEGDSGEIRTLAFDYNKGEKDDSVGHEQQDYENIRAAYYRDTNPLM